MRKHPIQIDRARELRRNATPAERFLWDALRSERFAEFKFRRQQPIGRYVVDFCCAATRVIVELDGETHRGREKEDGERQMWLEQRGYKVVRCTNHESYTDFEDLLEVIWRECLARKGIRWRGGPLTPNPSPPVGRGE